MILTFPGHPNIHIVEQDLFWMPLEVLAMSHKEL